MLTQGLTTSTFWVYVINLFFKFVYAFLCFKMKCYSSKESVCMLDVNLLRGDFVYFSFNHDLVSRFGVVCGDSQQYK